MSTIVTFRRQSHGSNAAVADRREGLRGVLVAIIAVYARIDDRLEKRRSRRLLAEMSDYQLKDIGLCRADAVKESARSFWD